MGIGSLTGQTASFLYSGSYKAGMIGWDSYGKIRAGLPSENTGISTLKAFSDIATLELQMTGSPTGIPSDAKSALEDYRETDLQPKAKNGTYIECALPAGISSRCSYGGN